MIGLFLFGIVGGALVVTVTLVPKVVADVSVTSIKSLSHWIEEMPAEKQEKLSHALQRIGNLVRGSNLANDPSSAVPNARP
jgi:hypothetical protein